MANPQDLRAAPMHEHDRRFNAVLGWSIAWSAIPASIFAGSILGLYTGQLSWQGALPSMAGSVAVMAVINFVGYKQKAPELRNPGRVMLFIALLTWCFVAWQTWMWFHPSIQLVQGYTQAQYDDAIAKAKDAAAKPAQDKLDKANQDNDALRQNIKQLTDALAKATAQPQAKSDAPVAVEKLPTSLKVLLKGTDFEVIGDTRNILTTATLIGYGQRPALLTPSSYPKLAILILFKKPIVFTDGHIEDHGTGIPAPELTYKNPYFAVLTFDSIYYSGLLDITFK
jgi:hypothetical protein